MKEFMGQKCTVHIKGDLFFKALILNVTDTHIIFRDKFNKNYCFNIEKVISIQDLK